MAIYNETAKKAINNRAIENAGEAHALAVIPLDRSGSMIPWEDDLNDAVRLFKESIQSDDLTKGRVEVCIIGYSDTADVIVPVCSAYDLEIPKIKCGGLTAGHTARGLALDIIEQRKAEYKANSTPYYRPWIFDLTDGAPTDVDNSSKRLLQAQRDGHCIYYGVAIGDNADEDLLKSLNKDGIALKATRENFANALLFFSNSLSKVSESNPNDRITLPQPEQYQLTVLT